MVDLSQVSVRSFLTPPTRRGRSRSKVGPKDTVDVGRVGSRYPGERKGICV